jgi:hypothetical protein
MALTADEIAEVRALVREELRALKLPGPAIRSTGVDDRKVAAAIRNLEDYLTSLVTRFK